MKRQENNIGLYSGLNFQDGRVSEDGTDLGCDVVGVVEDDGLAVRVAEDENLMAFISRVWSAIELQFSGPFGVKRKETVSSNGVKKRCGLFINVCRHFSF